MCKELTCVFLSLVVAIDGTGCRVTCVTTVASHGYLCLCLFNGHVQRHVHVITLRIMRERSIRVRDIATSTAHDDSALSDLIEGQK